MLKVVLCDDSKITLKNYTEHISRIAEMNHLEVAISCFNSGESLLFHYDEISEQIDILYMDILMAKVDGMETARKLRNSGCKAQIIFLTNCEDYVYDAYDLNAVHYLMKDNTSFEKFEEIFLRAVALASVKKGELFTFDFDGETHLIPVDQISYFEIWQRLVTVHYGNGEAAKFYASMEQLEKKLRGKDFARAHRSFLVHLPYIAMFRRQSLLLTTGKEIPVGGTYMQSLKQTFSDYIARFHICFSRTATEK